VNIYDWDYQREAVPSYKWRVVSDEPTDPSTERREAELSVLRREVDRLLADSESLRAMLVEQQRLLDATEADLARYRAMWEQSRPHQPERVAGVEQQLVLAGLLEALATSLPAANDDASADAPADPASTHSSGSPPPPDNRISPVTRGMGDGRSTSRTCPSKPSLSIRPRSRRPAALDIHSSAPSSPIGSHSLPLGTYAYGSCNAPSETTPSVLENKSLGKGRVRHALRPPSRHLRRTRSWSRRQSPMRCGHA
jgi:hypothetical protein